LSPGKSKKLLTDVSKESESNISKTLPVAAQIKSDDAKKLSPGKSKKLLTDVSKESESNISETLPVSAQIKSDDAKKLSPVKSKKLLTDVSKESESNISKTLPVAAQIKSDDAKKLSKELVSTISASTIAKKLELRRKTILDRAAEEYRDKVARNARIR
jgi:hypothetical protein